VSWLFVFSSKGDADLPRAIEVQNGFYLLPLSAYLRQGLAYNPPTSVVPAPVTSEAPADIRFFDLLGQAMQQMLPVAADSDDAFVASLHQIGLSAGNGFEWRALDEPVKHGLARAAKAGERIVDARWQTTGEVKNGWRYTTGGGRAGYDFALRAALAKNQLGAQLAQEVLYPNAQVDDKAEPFRGERKSKQICPTFCEGPDSAGSNILESVWLVVPEHRGPLHAGGQLLLHLGINPETREVPVHKIRKKSRP
jgi:hypothetical protein